MNVEAYHFSHHIRIGCKTFIVSYKPAGVNWGVGEGEGEGIFSYDSSMDRLFNPDYVDTNAPPSFRFDEVGKRKLQGTDIKRVELERIVEALHDMLDYDQEQRDEIAENAS